MGGSCWVGLLIVSFPALAAGFSGGGGNGQRPSSDSEDLVQTCDAINVCGVPPNGVCPSGMTLVAPPERSYVYTLRTALTGHPSSDPSSYIPGEIMTLYLRTMKRVILGKAEAGRRIEGNESSKYIGSLLYAVASGDPTEAKVGDWEVLLEERQKFWRPPDMPGCNRKVVMHAGPEPKNYLERFHFRGPPAGTGAIIFRALVKQGETNKGAFYWPVAPASSTPDALPVNGRANGDLVLLEAPTRAPTPWSYRGGVGESCAQVCARQTAQGGPLGLTCDEATLSSMTVPASLGAAVESSFVCALPLLATCGSSAPRMSGLGDGLCWYREDTCPTRPSSACDASWAQGDFESGLRLCPCVPRTSRRLDVNESDGSGGDAAQRPSVDASVKEFDIDLYERPVHRPRADDINDDELLRVLEEEAELARPCEPSAAEARLSNPPARRHGAGGSPSRCPSLRAAAREAVREAGTASSSSFDVALGPTPSMLWIGALSVAASLLLVAAAVWSRLLSRAPKHDRGGHPASTGTPRVRVLWRPRGSSKSRGVLAALTALAGLPTASPHNWARSTGSRAANAASTIKPCPQNRAPFPHIQVNVQQKFILEWATGHGGAQFWVMLKREDFGHLRRISRRLLWQYIAQAPPEAYTYFNDVPGHFKNPNASANLAWRKIHLRRYPNLPPNTIHANNMYRLDPDRPFEVPNQPAGYPTWTQRPWGRSRWTYLGYTDAKHCGTQACGQRRIAYNNSYWPWIQSVHRPYSGVQPARALRTARVLRGAHSNLVLAVFSIPWVYARSADAAQFAFPPGTEPGRYIAYFMWAGYRDCVDIDVLPDSKPVPMTLRGMYGYFDRFGDPFFTKTDHCQYATHHGASRLPPLSLPASRPSLTTCLIGPPALLAGTQKAGPTSSP